MRFIGNQKEAAKVRTRGMLNKTRQLSPLKILLAMRNSKSSNYRQPAVMCMPLAQKDMHRCLEDSIPSLRRGNFSREGSSTFVLRDAV